MLTTLDGFRPHQIRAPPPPNLQSLLTLVEIHDKPNVYAFLPELTASEGRANLDRSGPAQSRSHDPLDGLGDKTVIFGVISMGDPEPETPEVVAARIRAALEHRLPDRLIPAPIAA
jgi:5-methyltetrahydropteroyltriglutamate--homocysteine methyltransferase